MKFLQIHYFYEEYLRQLYRETPGLQSAPYSEQITALLNGGFYAPQIWGPYLEPLGYRHYFAVCNCMSAQEQWSAENDFTVPPGKDWKFEIVRRQIDVIKPDVLFLTLPTWYDASFLRTLTWKPRLVMAWRAASIRDGLDWTGIDVFLSQLGSCRQKALQIGARSAEHFFPGFPAPLLDTLGDVPKTYHVLFSGSFTYEFTRRNRFLHAAAAHLTKKDDTYGAAFFINAKDKNLLTPEVEQFARPPLWGLPMYRALKGARIVLNGEIDLAQGEAGNMRLFEVTGCGSFLLTQHHDNIHDYFTPGVEIETYKTPGELTEKLDYYFEHPEEREAVARRGQCRCLDDYSMDKRAAALDRIIKTHLKKNNR